MGVLIGAVLSIVLLLRRGMRPHCTILGRVPTLDLAGAEMLAEIHESLVERGIDLRLAEAHSGVRETLRRAGFEKFYGPIEPDQTVDSVLKQHPAKQS